MASYDDLVAAARKADQAGDSAGAKRLLELAVEAQGQVVMSTPDGGRVLRMPNGQMAYTSPGYSTSDPKQIERIMGGATGADTSRAGMQESIIAQRPVAARLGKFLEGVPAVGSYIDELLGAVGGPKESARALSSAMQETHPWQSAALGLGGGAVGTVGALAAMPEAAARWLGGLVTGPTGARTIPAMMRGLLAGGAAGATEGAVYGSGMGEAGTRGENALGGAAMGGAFGGLLGMAAPVVQKGVKNVADIFRRTDVAKIAKDLGISKEAATVIRNTFDTGGDMAAAQANLARAGSEGMLADAGPAAQALLDAAATSGGGPAQVVRSAVDERMARTGSALDDALNAALGKPPLGPKTAVAEIAARTAPARELAYNTAYNRPIDYSSPQGMKIEEVIGRIAPDDLIAGITEANKQMLSEGRTNQQIMAVLTHDGKVDFLREMPNVQQLDEIKKALQRMAYSPSNTDAFGRLTGTGQRYNSLAGQLRDAVVDAVPDYGAAVRIGGDKLAEDRAFSLGRDLLSPKTEIEDVMLELGRVPSQSQLDAARLGLRSYIAKTLGDVRAVASDPNIDARQVVKAVTDLSSDNAHEKITRLMGADAKALLAEIDKAAQSALVRTAVAANSRTAIRGSIQEGVEAQVAPGIAGQAMRGEPVNTTKALVQAITGQTAEFTEMQRQRIYSDIAKALTEKRGQTARAALTYLDQAMQGQPLTSAQNEFLAREITALGMAFGIPAAQEVNGR